MRQEFGSDLMTQNRIDKVSRVIHASPSVVYDAFAQPGALERWLPPLGMTGTMLAFDFREGGFYRMLLTYHRPHQAPGKTSEHSDEVEVRFIRLITDKRIEQVVNFNSEDPAFAGEMKITWTFEEVEWGTGVTVCCENVPVGIRPEDHEAGLTSTLENLAVFTEAGKRW